LPRTEGGCAPCGSGCGERLMAIRLIAQGAESKLYRDGQKLVKHRVKKSYRISQLDLRLRRYRNKREAKSMRNASKLINVPKILEVTDYKIIMEFIDGEILRDVISDLGKKEFMYVCKKIGEYIRILHSNDIVHGDLTTSNMIIKGEDLYFIDFGLSEVSKKDEAKAVDLHVLKEALNSKHYDVSRISWKIIKKSYGIKKVLDRLKVVEMRGRKKIKTCRA
jgi:TP53 regulating kinase-like protein